MREALRKLQAEDLITLQPGNALTVKSISEEQLIEIDYTGEALEGMAARLAAENAGVIELAKLRAIEEGMKTPSVSGNARQLRQLTGEFQLAVFRAARNDTIYRLLKHLQEQIRQFGDSSQRGRAKEVIADAKALVAAIEKRDGDATERIARENRRRTLELRIKMLRGPTRGA